MAFRSSLVRLSLSALRPQSNRGILTYFFLFLFPEFRNRNKFCHRTGPASYIFLAAQFENNNDSTFHFDFVECLFRCRGQNVAKIKLSQLRLTHSLVFRCMGPRTLGTCSLSCSGIGDVHSVFGFDARSFKAILAPFLKSIACIDCRHLRRLTAHAKSSQSFCKALLGTCFGLLPQPGRARRCVLGSSGSGVMATAQSDENGGPKQCKQKVFPQNNHILTPKDTFGSSCDLAHPGWTSSKLQS